MKLIEDLALLVQQGPTLFLILQVHICAKHAMQAGIRLLDQVNVISVQQGLLNSIKLLVWLARLGPILGKAQVPFWNATSAQKEL